MATAGSCSWLCRPLTVELGCGGGGPDSPEVHLLLRMEEVELVTVVATLLSPAVPQQQLEVTETVCSGVP